MQDILNTLLGGATLSEGEAARAIGLILEGRASEAQVGAMLGLIAQRGPTLDEIVGGARVMRRHATPVPISHDDPIRAHLVDTCGTGGTPKTFNISTAAAIVAGAARGPDGQRVYVAKHGGRSRSGRGSAEVLAALGVNIDASARTQARCLHDVGVCFSFAVNHHPAMKFAAAARKGLGFPTIFNLLGPLTNPAGAQRQLMGVYDERYVGPISEALARLGATRAMVVHGRDGMDEISTTAPTLVGEVKNGAVRLTEIDSASLGIGRAAMEDLRVPTLDDGAALIQRVLGGEHGPARDIVLVNAAAALVVGGAADSLDQGLEWARSAVDSGSAADTLAGLGRASHEQAG